MNNKYKIGAVCLAALFCLAMPASVAAATGTVDGETDAVVEFEEGLLEIVEVPTTLTFANTTLTGGPYTIPAAADDNDIVVNDGTLAKEGWHLTVDLGQFSNDGGTTITLEGATITANAVVPTGANVPDAEKATCPALVTVTSSATPTAVPVMTAAAGAGFGKWTATWTSANTNLNVPDTAQTPIGTHTADMTWLLAAGPS